MTDRDLGNVGASLSQEEYLFSGFPMKSWSEILLFWFQKWVMMGSCSVSG